MTNDQLHFNLELSRLVSLPLIKRNEDPDYEGGGTLESSFTGSILIGFKDKENGQK